MDDRTKYKTQNYKTLDNNTGEKLGDFGRGHEFLDITAKALSMKEKIVKLDFIKIKNFLAKDTVKRMKRQATD